MTSSQSTKPLDLEITVVFAKHLKNVNWRNGDLKPYAIFWLDPDRRLATKADHSGSTRPVWNERFTLPINHSLDESILNLEIFHSKPSETPKPLIGSLRFPLSDLVEPDDSNRIRKFELRLPSGRPQGQIRLKLCIRERPLPDYQVTPPPSYYYSSSPSSHFPPPPLVHDYRGFTSPPVQSPPLPQMSSVPPPYPQYGSYSDNVYSFYPTQTSYYPAPQQQAVLPPRPFFDRQSNYGGPSAPVDYSEYSQKPRGGKMGIGAGVAVGAVAGTLGGLTLEEGLKYQEEKNVERVEDDTASRDDYSDYRGKY